MSKIIFLRNMDDSLSSIDENSFVITEMEKEVLEDMERFNKEALEELDSISFHAFVENEHESEEETDSESDDETASESGGDEDRERSLHFDRSFVSEVDKNSASFAANLILHQSNSEYENKMERKDSCSESGAFTPFHSSLISHVSDKYDCSSTTGETRQNSTNPNENILVSNPYDKKKLNIRAPIHSARSGSSIIVKALKEEYQKLFILYEANFLELTTLKEKEMNCKKEMHNAIKTLKLNLDLLENEKDKLGYNLQESKNLILNFERGENKLEEILTLKSQLSSMCEIKDEIQHKLETSKAAIYSLEIQLNNPDEAGHLSQHCYHHSNILEEMKLHHEKDILICRQNIDQLQSKLNSKLEEAEDWALKNSELEKKCQQLEIEKFQRVNRMSEEFVAQKKCQLFLESGTIEEINRLKLQVQRLEEEKSNIERENSLLKESFLRRWARSLLSWQLHGLRRVNDMIGLPFF